MSEQTQEKQVWYSALCGYWTDDWSQLQRVGPRIDSGIPACPECGCPGFVTTEEDWLNGVEGYDDEHPGYKEFIDGIKGKCLGRGGLTKTLRERGFA